MQKELSAKNCEFTLRNHSESDWQRGWCIKNRTQSNLEIDVLFHCNVCVLSHLSDEYWCFSFNKIGTNVWFVITVFALIDFMSLLCKEGDRSGISISLS